jgi:hypothetical protein
MGHFSQALTDTAPVLLLNLPFGQSIQNEAPATELYDPASQFTQPELSDVAPCV